MTQKCIKSLATEALYEIECLEYERNLLDIAVKQCELESELIVEHIEILISSYLSHIEPHFDALRLNLENIVSVAEISCIDISVDELKF